ncbi:MAG: translation initiation factor IF-2 [Candidatus Diapherotrites archaeon]|nr:translation initiation factor IF-2 [Candidatus Diapherotrites archaeon]
MKNRKERFPDEEDALRNMMESHQAGLWTALPCLIDSVDLVKQTVSAQPTIKGTVSKQDGTTEEVDLPLLVDVPIMFPRAGGFALTFPIAEGDECLVVFASRCIDSWWQSGGIQSQAEKRMHDLSDGFCMLAPTSQPNVLENVSATSVQLRSEDGADIIEIDPDHNIKMENENGSVKLFENGMSRMQNDNGKIEIEDDGKMEMFQDSTHRITIGSTGNIGIWGGTFKFNGDTVATV